MGHDLHLSPTILESLWPSKVFPRHLQDQPRLAQSPVMVCSPAMRGQQQAGPSGRSSGLPLTLWLFDLPGTSEGQREKETLNQNSEGLKIKRVLSLLSIRLLPAANTVAANKMLDWLDPQLRAAHLSACIGAATIPIRRKALALKLQDQPLQDS